MSKKPFDRLAADAIAAEKAGMSYGKWKAFHPHTPEPEPEKKVVPVHIKGEPIVKKCLCCGAEFVVVGHNACRKYCDDTCRDRAAMRRYREAHPLQVRNCLFCGKAMDAKGNRSFCSNACKMNAYRLRKIDGGKAAV